MRPSTNPFLSAPTTETRRVSDKERNDHMSIGGGGGGSSTSIIVDRSGYPSLRRALRSICIVTMIPMALRTITNNGSDTRSNNNDTNYNSNNNNNIDRNHCRYEILLNGDTRTISTSLLYLAATERVAMRHNNTEEGSPPKIYQDQDTSSFVCHVSNCVPFCFMFFSVSQLLSRNREERKATPPPLSADRRVDCG